MARVVLFSLGSRGDSEPLAALAQTLVAAGHDARLVTGHAEHRGLGFETRLWSEAFFLAVRFGAGQDHSRRATLRRLVAHLPALGIGLILALVQVVSALLASLPRRLRAAGRADLRVRGLLDQPSLIDRVQLLDAVLRNHWRAAAPTSRALLARWLGPLLETYPVPGRILDFIDTALADADIVLLAEGADDPVRERLVLALSAELGGVDAEAARRFIERNIASIRDLRVSEEDAMAMD